MSDPTFGQIYACGGWVLVGYVVLGMFAVVWLMIRAIEWLADHT